MQTIIHTPTNQLSNSLQFYEKLGFKLISNDSPVLVTDGKVIIEINPERFARPGVKLLKSSWKETVEELAAMVNIIKLDTGYLLSDLSGVWIYLEESNENPLNMIEDTEGSVLGNYAGISLETTDVYRSMQIWHILGFSENMGTLDQGWISLVGEDQTTISIMSPNNCPHLFFNPSLTYFNGVNNLEVIDKIKSLDILISEEITYFNKEGTVDNIIIRDPGGYGFFIFND